MLTDSSQPLATEALLTSNEKAPLVQVLYKDCRMLRSVDHCNRLGGDTVSCRHIRLQKDVPAMKEADALIWLYGS